MTAVILAVLAQNEPGEARRATLFTSAIVFYIATIANDNTRKDLKTGQLVGATPWKQQVALDIGVVSAR